MKYDVLDKVNKLNTILGNLKTALIETSLFKEDSSHSCRILRGYGVVVGEIDLEGCYLADKIADAAHRIITAEIELIKDQLIELGVSFEQEEG